MNMRKALVIILVSALLLSPLMSCTYNAVFLLSEEDLEWFEPYQDGDVVLFSAADGRVDTMIVTRNIHNTPGILGFYYFSNFYGGGKFINTMHHDNYSFEYYLLIRSVSQDSTSIAMCFNRRFSSDELQVGDTTEVIVKGHVYHDALMIDDGNSHISPDDRVVGINCEYFIWSKSKGLLEYKYQDGEVYTLYKRVTFGEKEWWGAFPFWRQLKWYLSEL